MGFELIIRLMPERFACAVLVQTLAKRWWDITHTFHITDWGMTITPHGFHRMIDLWFDGVLISLEDELGIYLDADLLRRRYATKMICNTNLE